MKAHIHAELMMQYAKDAMETDKPWERWEYKSDSPHWLTCHSITPSWFESVKYRRKAQTININGHEVPEPYRGEMKIGQTYYIPRLGCGSKYDIITWDNNGHDHRYRFKGLLHLTIEAAFKHTEALLSFTLL
jgi:hypothetical protein